MKKLLLTTAMLLATTPVMAAIFGDGYGTNIKSERITVAELKKIRSLGIKRVRVSIMWYAVEQQPGVYRWDVQLPRREDADDYATRKSYTFDELLGQLAVADLRGDVTFVDGNAGLLGLVNVAGAGEAPQWRHRAPHSDAELDKFAAFAAATVAHYEKLYPGYFRWHVWNEPDTDGGFPPKTDPAVIGKLLTKTCEAIRQVSPKATVMGPALGAYGDGDLRYDFMAGLFKETNPLTCLSGFTFHPYRSAPPETAPVDYNKVRAVLAPHQPRTPVPVAVDEWGYSINKNTWDIPTQRWRDRSQEEQAALTLRAYLTNLQANMPLTVTYEWRDSGTSPTDWEHHFGATAYDGSDKATARMYAYTWPTLSGRPLVWAQAVSGCSAKERLQRYGARVQKGDGTSWMVLWSWGEKPVPVTLTGQVLAIKNMFGADIQQLTQLTGRPVLVQHVTGQLPVVSCQR